MIQTCIVWKTINRNYTGFCVSDNELLRIVGARRLDKGGIAIMWHNSLSSHISCLDIESDHICGIEVRLKDLDLIDNLFQ